jgi:hypothetical protein
MELTGQIHVLRNLNVHLAVGVPEDPDDVDPGTQTLPALHGMVASPFEGSRR